MSDSGERHNYNADCQDDEFMVAADFTLYANPIHRALYRPSPPATTNASNSSTAPREEAQQPPDVKGQQQQQQQPADEEKSTTSVSNKEDTASAATVTEEEEWIASDMTMYDSPLADLERQHCYARDSLDPAASASLVLPPTIVDPPPSHELENTPASDPVDTSV